MGCVCTPQEPKRTTRWDRKILKLILKNVLLEGLTISMYMYFQQFEDLKFQNFSGEACPQTPLNAFCLQHMHDLSFKH